VHESIKLTCIKNIKRHPMNNRAGCETFLKPPVHIAHLESLDIICTDKRQAKNVVNELNSALAPILKRQTRRLRRQIRKNI
jgi:hypothetical protein